MDHDPAARGARSAGAADQDLAAKWITARAPLKILDGAGRAGHSIIRYCPWCGGAAPPSKRGTFFAHITDAESRRLRELASDVKTVEEAIAKFGEPDLANPSGLRTQSPASDTEPSVVRSYRVLRYSGLSETAHVNFTDYGPERGLHVTLQSKYVGEPEAKP